ncbi:MAG: hypothetical protein H0T42_17295 [Deltaproteobacteria bacterium]|nr:hypothetical protein [Deltaproteobacteria bacterium]
MGMCAIYTAIPPPSPEQLIALAKDNEGKTYGEHRCTLGRKAVAELVAALAPPSHAALATAILERDLWGFLTPAATRGNHVAALARANPDVAIPSPIWPPTTELACLLGVPPAHYIGSNLVLLPADLVSIGVDAFEKHEEKQEVAAYLNDFLRRARAKNEAVLLHWDYR